MTTVVIQVRILASAEFYVHNYSHPFMLSPNILNLNIKNELPR